MTGLRRSALFILCALLSAPPWQTQGTVGRVRLRQTIVMAREPNPEVQIAFDQFEQARGKIIDVQAGTFPKVTLEEFGLAFQDSSAGTRLLREPDVSQDRIAFIYAGDLWTAPRDGGTASRLTRTPDAESRPRFSPQGRDIAFTRNGDVYVIPAAGGDERRLTWHPSPDLAIAWTPDGSRLLIRSDRLKGDLTRNPHLFLVPLEGGLAEPLPIPRALYGSFSPDGQQIAYGPNPELVLHVPWKRYRGGSLGYIAVYDLAGNRYWELPRTSANDVCPLWHKQSIYFLSDRDGIMNLYRYGRASRQTERLTSYKEWDVKNTSLGPDAIIYENGGWLFELNLTTGKIRQISVSVPQEAPPATEEHTRWRQALDVAWRTYRDRAFYPVPGWDDLKPRFEDLISWAAHPSDAESVLRDMLGEASQSHIILKRSDRPGGPGVGLLGADFRFEQGFYRIVKIYGRPEGDEKATGPLATPEIGVREGDFLIAVAGRPVRKDAEIYAAFQGMSGEEVTLRVNRAPSEAGAREIVVRTLPDESRLRYAEWVRSNSAQVAEATQGQVGYLHVGNVDSGGVEQFRREWSAQRSQVAAMIIDARNNSGGGQADEVVNWIVRRPTRLMYDRRGRVPPWDYFLDGPKAMIVNDQSVSGGDELAYLFKQKKAGPLVGTRTFGGMIGSGATYKITGGWELLVPEFGFYWLEAGTWSPENHGVEPDYLVELKPDALTGGRDPQLEKAIELMIAALATYKKIPDAPPYNPFPAKKD